MTTYTLHRDTHNNILPCNSCGLPVPTKEDPRYCQFCTTTDASYRITETYRCEETRIQAEVWKAAAAVYNYITFPELIFPQGKNQ